MWDFYHTHYYDEGSPSLKMPFRCPGCKRDIEAFAESQTGNVEEIRIALTSNELDHNKYLANKAGDLPGLFRLELKHAYLDMRVIAWENGGPEPCSEAPSDNLPGLEKFEDQFKHILKVIDLWWEDEPFMIEILNNRINKRMANLRNGSIDIPKNDLTAKAYDDFLDNLITKRQAKPQEELTSEIMLRRIQPPMPLDMVRGTLASGQWPWIFASEARILLIEENKLFEEENRKVSLSLTIDNAREGDLTALKKLVAWDYAWITCPWVSELIRTQPYDFDIQEMMKDALSGRPGYFTRKQKPDEQAVEQENLMQFLYDRFRADLKDTDKFFEKVYNDKFEDSRQGYENIKKFRKAHLRK